MLKEETNPFNFLTPSLLFLVRFITELTNLTSHQDPSIHKLKTHFNFQMLGGTGFCFFEENLLHIAVGINGVGKMPPLKLLKGLAIIELCRKSPGFTWDLGAMTRFLKSPVILKSSDSVVYIIKLVQCYLRF